jgi:hypothetical protein
MWIWLNPVATGVFIGAFILLWLTARCYERMALWIRIATFLAVLILPLAGLMTGYSDDPKEFAQMEKRRQASFAQKDIAPLHEAPDNVEAWFNDHFGFRGKLIRSYAEFMYKFFGKSINPDNVVIGKDGFFFLGNWYSHIIDRTRDRNGLSEEEIETRAAGMLAMQNDAERKGVRFYLAVAPNKHSVYPDKLPMNLPATQKTFYDRMFAAYAAKGINQIPLRDAMRAARQRFGDDLFLKTDSHWSSLGAYAATSIVINRIAEDFPQVSAPQASRYGKKEHRSGDLLGIARLPADASFYQTVLNWNPKASSLTFQFYANGGISHLYTTPPTQEIPHFAELRVVNKAAGNKLKALVLKDSFVKAMSPFINNTFYETIYCNGITPQRVGLSVLLERHKPDLVIVEIVERDMLRSNLTKR